MYLRLLHESDTPPQTLSNEGIKYSTELKEKGLFNKFLTTLMDYCSNFLFGGQPTHINRINENLQISQDISNLFTNSKIHVYIYDSKVPNAFTIPGFVADNISIRTALFIQIPIIGYIFVLFIKIKAMISRYSKVFSSTYKDNLLTYNNGKFDIPIDEISVFIASVLIEGLTDDEIIAILLHEVGHNTQVTINVISELIGLTFCGMSIGSILGILDDKSPYNGRLPIFIGIFILSLVGLFFYKYYRRRQEVYADEFAIKCGYGNALNSALTKIKSHTYGFGQSMIKLNILDKFIYYVNKTLSAFGNAINYLHLGVYPSWGQRLDMIKRKTENYNIDGNIIDRSEHIENY